MVYGYWIVGFVSGWCIVIGVGDDVVDGRGNVYGYDGFFLE